MNNIIDMGLLFVNIYRSWQLSNNNSKLKSSIKFMDGFYKELRIIYLPISSYIINDC